MLLRACGCRVKKKRERTRTHTHTQIQTNSNFMRGSVMPMDRCRMMIDLFQLLQSQNVFSNMMMRCVAMWSASLIFFRIVRDAIVFCYLVSLFRNLHFKSSIRSIFLFYLSLSLALIFNFPTCLVVSTCAVCKS